MSEKEQRLGRNLQTEDNLMPGPRRVVTFQWSPSKAEGGAEWRRNEMNVSFIWRDWNNGQYHTSGAGYWINGMPQSLTVISTLTRLGKPLRWSSRLMRDHTTWR